MRHFNYYLKFFINTLSYLNLRKILNFLQIYLSYIFSLKRPNFNSQFRPAYISVEPADFCQLRCPECPVGQKAKSKGENIKHQVYLKMIDELKPYLLHVIFYFQGEPLLNKNLNEMINYAHKAKIFTSTSTNAQLLNSDTSKKLVLSGLDKLIISIDGSTQEVYEKYRKGGKLDKAIQGVKFVEEWKKSLKSVTPLVEIQFVVTKANEHQINEMKLLARSLNANRLVFKSAQLYNFENGNDLMTSFAKYSRYRMMKDGKYVIKNKLPNKCMRMWSGAVITTSAELLPCCFDKDASHSFGNIAENSFAEVWHNEKATDFRTSILTNRKQHEICRNCTGR